MLHRLLYQKKKEEGRTCVSKNQILLFRRPFEQAANVGQRNTGYRCHFVFSQSMELVFPDDGEFGPISFRWGNCGVAKDCLRELTSPTQGAKIRRTFGQLPNGPQTSLAAT